MATNEELKEEVETANDKANALTDEKLTNVSGGLALDNVNEDDNDTLEEALRRFKRKTQRDNIIAEVRKREHYEKPIAKRKKRAEAARTIKY